MLQVLTKEECLASQIADEKKMQIWWNSLSHRERKRIFDHNEKLIRQVNCGHKWHDSNFYGDPIECCQLCDLTREKK